MTGYLLDTRVFLTVLDDISGLSTPLKAIFDDKEAVFYVSSASFFEIAVKKALKKVKIPDNLTEIAEASGLRVLPIQPDHALRTVRLPYHHTDPYDRLLIAQAKIEGLTLATRDAIFAKYDIPTVMA